VDRAIRGEIAKYQAHELVGVSCLADGADQIFARAILDHGGQLEVVIPASEYRDGLPEESHAAYDALLARARTRHRLDRRTSDADADMEASRFMLANADRLIAVWDGKPARGHGGTADVLALAQQHGTEVTVVWPSGANRDASAVT